MKIVAEISMYPLKEQYIQPIQEFIDRLNTYKNIKVITTATSTTVCGEYLPTMQMLGEEMQRSHEKIGQAIFVCKFLNGDKMSTDL
ncbi:hypothetical protein [Paraglaciecola psychrophila]|uniref:Thiamin/hydroxymethyl pyrimidine-binding YkoF putative domain-containing protein n=1 Tax=Paraglaciecola psychrophila 170 TaxID=1129794 RepID=K7A7B9_9ALTE|nr:hypothetical protein [Paraglaciecola psychrophila]AGH45707.1 hypothetical protein C427_3599 [Paraglaciecola psychrophila 170]GAC38227.1 conserved hypothetical protein [Paraglaciecola psychrophila 170]